MVDQVKPFSLTHTTDYYMSLDIKLNICKFNFKAPVLLFSRLWHTVISEQITEVVPERRHNRGASIENLNGTTGNSKKIVQPIKLFFGV